MICKFHNESCVFKFYLNKLFGRFTGLHLQYRAKNENFQISNYTLPAGNISDGLPFGINPIINTIFPCFPTTMSNF